MFRKDLIELLLDNPLRVSDIAKLFEVPTRDAVEDLRHLVRTLKKSEYRLKVSPAECHKCGFMFSVEKLAKPGKCPRCKGTWIAEPCVEIVST
jgi:predicted Zn-ribbon and HTH transcriptional regulator